MAEGWSYRAPAGPAEAEIRRRDSRFRARLVPVTELEAAPEVLNRIRQEDASATHHCWAWRIGWPPTERSSDAGEPSGTAGGPILRVLDGGGISDALLVVSRWFGGTKLGRGGLTRAYGAAARACLEEATLAHRFETRQLVVELPYDRLGGMERLLADDRVTIRRQNFAETVRFELEIEASREEALVAEIANLGPTVRLTRLTREEARHRDPP